MFKPMIELKDRRLYVNGRLLEHPEDDYFARRNGYLYAHKLISDLVSGNARIIGNKLEVKSKPGPPRTIKE